MKKPFRKFIVFPLTGILVAILFTLASLVVVDLYLHHKFNKQGGYNAWGYRGPIAGKKKKGEKRIVVLGGSTAFGYGLKPYFSFPAYLDRKLNAIRKKRGKPPISVVNLAWNEESAYASLPTLEDYESLDYDIVILYSGYNDLGGHIKKVFRRGSVIFRTTGYLPIFPIIFREKAFLLAYGNVDAGYDTKEGRKKIRFQPNLANRATAAALTTAADIATSINDHFGRLSEPDKVIGQARDLSCKSRWQFYCNSIRRAVEFAFARGKKVLVVSQPYISDTHVKQQLVLENMLKEKYGNNPNIIRVNLGKSISTNNRSLVYDGSHLTEKGSELIASRLIEPILEVIR